MFNCQLFTIQYFSLENQLPVSFGSQFLSDTHGITHNSKIYVLLNINRQRDLRNKVLFPISIRIIAVAVKSTQSD